MPDPAEINTVGRVILLSEASAVLQPYLDRREDFGADVLSLLDQGRLVSATDYIDAQRLRTALSKAMGETLGSCRCRFHPNDTDSWRR